jgi:hypothetical protein
VGGSAHGHTIGRPALHYHQLAPKTDAEGYAKHVKVGLETVAVKRYCRAGCLQNSAPELSPDADATIAGDGEPSCLQICAGLLGYMSNRAGLQPVLRE